MYTDDQDAGSIHGPESEIYGLVATSKHVMI